ncbi:hypothetical protein P8859_06090 [Bacillus spizizenii]|uniref:hypothetical protein n=1 Tax=Bacillus sp. FSL R5-0603 TaxID=2975307 RepID=UPI0022821B1D|nr:hypothetical protein [Bacillus spizizenii]MCY8255371.1 hypothetical protein [Bacillus spizizenii]MCY8315119.1 hypothetical protein [Bacillus spizizenii]MCY8418703.1 hypothetical protein [Bacillus spizizenii]MCY9334327.1 hypothetical protein [Bacillus spizizenii]
MNFVLQTWIGTTSDISTGLITGVATGIVTGFIVTIYFRKRDATKEKKRTLYEKYMYLRTLKRNLDLLLNDENKKDRQSYLYFNIISLLIDEQLPPHLALEGIKLKTEEDKYLREANKTYELIYKEFVESKGIISDKKIKKMSSKLLKDSTNLLTVTNKIKV